jgi:hypothetical protein
MTNTASLASPWAKITCPLRKEIISLPAPGVERKVFGLLRPSCLAIEPHRHGDTESEHGYREEAVQYCSRQPRKWEPSLHHQTNCGDEATAKRRFGQFRLARHRIGPPPEARPRKSRSFLDTPRIMELRSRQNPPASRLCLPSAPKKTIAPAMSILQKNLLCFQDLATQVR